VAQQVIPLEQGMSKLVKAVELVVRSTDLTLMGRLKEMLARYPGTVPVLLRVEMPGQAPVHMRLAEDLKVDPIQDLLDPLVSLLGLDAVLLKKQPLARPVGENTRRFGGGRGRNFSQEE
jgi:DNA-directed RNA polymerase subunit L